MSHDRIQAASRWVYQGIWAVLVRWFRVPPDPPTLPVLPQERLEVFHPAPGYLSLLKFIFWVVLTIADGLAIAIWVGITVALPILGALLFPFLVMFVILPDVLAYIGIHLRYDTTWYVVSNRSLRLRRGIWIIHETTITFENIQNVVVQQGPLQRWFGIADVLIQTAGGGTGASSHGQTPAWAGSHLGLFEGVANAHEIRDLIWHRVRATRSAGLNDERAKDSEEVAWTAEHLTVLGEIRQAVQGLSA